MATQGPQHAHSSHVEMEASMPSRRHDVER